MRGNSYSGAGSTVAYVEPPLAMQSRQEVEFKADLSLGQRGWHDRLVQPPQNQGCIAFAILGHRRLPLRCPVADCIDHRPQLAAGLGERIARSTLRVPGL